jgi:hypothetical protein
MNHTNDATFKAVVALNNSGVTLIQHHRYMEGLLTLKDALKLMKNAFEADHEHQKQVNEALQDVWHRTSQMYEDNGSCPIADILVVTDHANPFEVYNELERNPGKLCCVKIDPMVEWESSCTSDRFNVESSIIMHNYGVAHLLTAMVLPRSGAFDATVYTQTSYQLFELAHSVIDTHLMTSDEFDIPPNVLLVSMLTNTCLYQISMLTPQDRRTTTNLKCLEWVLSTIVTQESLYPMLSPVAAACA